jgi:hypothetical protein
LLATAFLLAGASPAQAGAAWSTTQISTGAGGSMTNCTISGDYAVWVEHALASSPPVLSYSVYLRDLSAGVTTRIATQSTTGDPYIGDGYVVWGAGDGVYLYDIDSGTPGSPLQISAQQGSGATVDGGYVVWNHTEGPYHETVWMYEIATGTTTLLSDRVAADVWARIEDGYVIWQSQTLEPHGWQLKLHDIATGTTQTLDEIVYENCTNEDQGALINGGRVLWMVQDASDFWQVKVYDIALGTETQITTDAHDHEYARIAGDWVTYRTVTNEDSGEVWLYNLETESSTRICESTTTPGYYTQNLRTDVDASGNVVWERSWQNLDPEQFADYASEILSYSAVTGQTAYITPQYVLGHPPATVPMFASIDGGRVVFWSQPDFEIYLATRAQTYGVDYSLIIGKHRYETAQLVSRAMFPDPLPVGCGVVVAPGETFQEALCGAPLAAAYGGPVLLTPKAGLENGTKAELLRLAPTYVFCIGLSTTAVNGVKAALPPSTTVTSITGSTVYHMSHNVANALKAKLIDMSGMTAIVTIGTKFPDAIGVSPLACSQFWPIILTDRTDSVLHAQAQAALADLGIRKVLKVGTYSKLPTGIEGIDNLSGNDRYYTNAKVAQWAAENAGLTFAHTAVATGDKFPDALAAGPFLAQDGGTLLLSPLLGPLPTPIATTVTAHRTEIEQVTFIACIQPVIGQVKALLPNPPVVTAISPASGPAAGGTVVTITGANFTGATGVRFGATAATTFTVHSATQITATAPAGSGTVDVTVNGPTGTSTTNLADRFRYIPFPVVTALDPASGTTLGGTTVTITGTGFSGATAVHFGAIPAAHFTVDSPEQITATTPPHGSATVDIRVTTPGGTSVADGPAGPANDFTFLAIPEVTALSPTWGPPEGGTVVTITGANFTGATAVQFGGTDATTFTVVSDTEITATSPAHEAGPFPITVTGPEGVSLPVDEALFRFGSPTRYEQDDALIVYAGNWATVVDPNASGGSRALTASVGAQVHIAFTGTRFDWIATKSTSQGLATVSLDNGPPVTVDLSSTTTAYQQTVWSSGPIQEGVHVVTVMCLAQAGSAGTGVVVDIDAVSVVGALAELPPADLRDGLVVIDGSSQAVGYGATPGNDWGSRVIATIENPSLGAWLKRNVASGGQTVAMMAADAATQVDVLYNSAYHHNICIVWEGCISISNGYTSAQLHDELKAYCLARRAAGFQVVLLTVLPYGDNPESEVRRTSANALIRADWTDYADALADVALDSRIGEAGDQNNTTYYLVDKWHLNDAGNAIVADIVRTAVEGLY